MCYNKHKTEFEDLVGGKECIIHNFYSDYVLEWLYFGYTELNKIYDYKQVRDSTWRLPPRPFPPRRPCVTVEVCRSPHPRQGESRPGLGATHLEPCPTWAALGVTCSFLSLPQRASPLGVAVCLSLSLLLGPSDERLILKVRGD